MSTVGYVSRFSSINTELPVRINNNGFVGQIISTAEQEGLISNGGGSNTVNLYTLGNYQNTGEFNTNSTTLSSVSSISINNFNYYQNNVENWYSSILNGINTSNVILQLTNPSDLFVNAKYSITDGQFTNPPGYRGFSYYYKRVWQDDPSINQIIIFDSSISGTVMTYDPTTEDDEFKVDGISSSNIVAYAVIYGDTSSEPISLTKIDNFFKSFVDNVLYGGGGSIVSISNMKTNFYSNFNTLYNQVSPLYTDFELVDRSFTVSVDETASSGINFQANIRYISQTYLNIGIAIQGSGYSNGDTVKIYGTQLNGTTPENDLILTITSVGGSGEVLSYSVTSGVANALDGNFISDGGDDQYDSGNYLNNEFNTEINYGRGEIVNDQFGSGSQFFTAYQDSIFIMIAKDNSSNSFYITGNLGADGDGDVDAGQVSGNNGPISLNVNYLGGSGTLSSGDIYSIDFYSLGGNWNKNSNDEVYTLNYAGIGTTNPGYPLDVQSNEGGISINAIADIQATDFINPSDIRIKKDIVSINSQDSLNIINKLNVKTYKKISNIDGKDEIIGFIAQEVKDADEKLVKQTSNFIPNINKTFTVFKMNELYVIKVDESIDINENDVIRILIDNQLYEVTILKKEINGNDIYCKFSYQKEIINKAVYIYGKKVDDFLLIKNNSILTHLVNAVKQLSHDNQYLKTRLIELENKTK